MLLGKQIQFRGPCVSVLLVDMIHFQVMHAHVWMANVDHLGKR